MIRQVDGSLFDGDVDIIAHQVNCRGIMGSGVAKQVRTLFPEVYVRYRRHHAKAVSPGERGEAGLLGDVLFVNVLHKGSPVTVANLFSQLSFGYDGRRYTDYDAIRSCMKVLGEYALALQRQGRGKIGLPYRIGCDRGGGDWDTVLSIIRQELGHLDVTLFRLPG